MIRPLVDCRPTEPYVRSPQMVFAQTSMVRRRVVIDDRCRLPGRFFGRFATSATSELTRARQRRARCRLFRASIALVRSPEISLELTLMSKPTTLYDKIWNDHLVHEAEDGTCLLYIDRHLVHEVTSPQAFEGLRATGRKVHAPDKTLAVVDHNIPPTAGS